MFNIACWYWAISLMAETRLRESHAAEYYLLMFSIIVVSPSLLAIGTYSFGLLTFCESLSSTHHRRHGIFFPVRGEIFWILFHLKSGQRLGG